MNKNLNPHWVTGLIDMKGSFYIRIIENKAYKTGFSVQLCFEISLDNKEKDLLLEVKSFFKVGDIYSIDKNGMLLYQVRNLNEIIDVIIFHLDKYSLRSQKYKNFSIFKEIVKLMANSQHLNIKGLRKIIYLKLFLSKGYLEDNGYFPKKNKI